MSQESIKSEFMICRDHLWHFSICTIRSSRLRIENKRWEQAPTYHTANNYSRTVTGVVVSNVDLADAGADAIDDETVSNFPLPQHIFYAAILGILKGVDGRLCCIH